MNRLVLLFLVVGLVVAAFLLGVRTGSGGVPRDQPPAAGSIRPSSPEAPSLDGPRAGVEPVDVQIRTPAVASASAAGAGEGAAAKQADPLEQDPAIDHFRKSAEHLLTLSGRTQVEDSLRPDSGGFQNRYNPNRKTLSTDETQSLVRTIRDLNGKVTDAKVAAAIEEFVQAEEGIRNGRYQTVESSVPMDPENYRIPGEETRVFIAPGASPGVNRVLVFTRRTHPRLFTIMDEVLRLKEERDRALRAYFQ